MADTIETLKQLRELGARSVSLYQDGGVQHVEFSDPIAEATAPINSAEDLIKALEGRDDEERSPAMKRMLERRSQS